MTERDHIGECYAAYERFHRILAVYPLRESEIVLLTIPDDIPPAFSSVLTKWIETSLYERHPIYWKRGPIHFARTMQTGAIGRGMRVIDSLVEFKAEVLPPNLRGPSLESLSGAIVLPNQMSLETMLRRAFSDQERWNNESDDLGLGVPRNKRVLKPAVINEIRRIAAGNVQVKQFLTLYDRAELEFGALLVEILRTQESSRLKQVDEMTRLIANREESERGE